jgi:hypothetical protein
LNITVPASLSVHMNSLARLTLVGGCRGTVY